MLFSRYLIHESAASFDPERGGPELRGSRCQEEGRALVSCLPGEAARSAWPEHTWCSSSRRLRGCHLSRFDPRKATCKTCPPFSRCRVAPSFVVGGKAGECVSGRALGLREGGNDWPRRCCGGGAGGAWTHSKRVLAGGISPAGAAPRGGLPAPIVRMTC